MDEYELEPPTRGICFGVTMKTAELRKTFVEFFQAKDHTFVPSSSLFPVGDRTVLFTIAGMVQFKAALIGEEQRPYRRAANFQKCVRVSDLDNVGKNGRHHTFFEMLGNWSFGDYGKKEAIEWALEFLRDVVKMDLRGLWVTVHLADDEAEQHWINAGFPRSRIRRLDRDNFWEMGPTGPCGPCSEIYIDQGPAVAQVFHARTRTVCTEGPGCDCDRFLEFWNLVFMQFERHEDGSLTELPFKSVDTGAGLERFAAILQGHTSNFDIDIFAAIKRSICERAALSTDLKSHSSETHESLNVVADHVRMLTFALADGMAFGNEGRGYVLRRVLRRAVLHAHRLDSAVADQGVFLANIVAAVVREMGDSYPEIVEHQKRVADAIAAEEKRFFRTLALGLERFQGFVDDARCAQNSMLSGDRVFLLHDTFGFPADLTRVLCEENGLTADLEGFAKCMAEQRERSRAEAKFYQSEDDDSPWIIFHAGSQDEEKRFVGYGVEVATGVSSGRDIAEISIDKSRIRKVRQLKNGFVELVLAETPFYAESGGQVSDHGWIRAGTEARPLDFEVVDVRKTPGAIIHLLSVTEGENEPLSESDLREIFLGGVTAVLDLTLRLATARNHTATHLLHKALREVLGGEVRQAGSLVNPDGLRFDFSMSRAMEVDEIRRVEEIVNQQILRNTSVITHVDVAIENAKSMGAVAIFDEKYEDKVRVIEIPGFSMELCGGTHVSRAGTIGLFKILAEGSVTAGVRRIEGVTGMEGWRQASRWKDTLTTAAAEAQCAERDLVARIRHFRDVQRDLEKTIGTLQFRLVSAEVNSYLSQIVEVVAGVRVLSVLAKVGGVDELEMLTDRLKERVDGLVVVGAAIDGKAVLFAAAHPQLVAEWKPLGAGAVIREVATRIGGKGGGRPEFARGGGPQLAQLAQVLASVPDIVKGLLPNR